MIRALKMTADRIAERGVSRSMTLSRSRAGSTPENMAGMMAKYLATSLAIEKVVSAPRVMSSCLPISTISMSFVGFESRSTMFPASLAAWVPVFMATPDVGLGQRRGVVGAVAGHGDEPAAGLLPADEVHLVLGRGLGEEVVDAGLGGDGLGGERVVAGDHHRADAHGPQLVEAVADALLDDVLEVDDAEDLGALGDDQRRAAGRWRRPRPARRARRARARPARRPSASPSRRRPCARTLAVEVEAAHAGLGGERDEGGVADVALAEVEPLLGQHHDRAALRRLVGQAGQLRGRGEPLLRDAGERAGTPPPGGCRG